MKYTHRMKENRIFKYVLKKGTYARGAYLAVHTAPMRYEKDSNCLGICVSKKNGNSVARNKLKRWVREIYREEEKFLTRGYQIVVLYKKNVTLADMEFFKVRDDIKKCFKELGLYGKTK